MLNIALNTFKEIVRNKFLYLILVFAFLFIVFSIALGKLTIGEGQKVITDFGIAMIEIFGLIGVLFVGSQLLFKEIEGKTIFLILSKPIRRYEFIFGKFLGFVGVIFAIVFFQSICYLGVLYFQDIPIDSLLVMSLVFIFLKLVILIGLVLFFSTFMSNILTIVISIMVYLIAHSFSLAIDLANKTHNDLIINGAYILQGIFPPYQFMNFKDRIGSISLPTLTEYTTTSLHAVLFLMIILVFTTLIFNKKKFEN